MKTTNEILGLSIALRRRLADPLHAKVGISVYIRPDIAVEIQEPEVKLRPGFTFLGFRANKLSRIVSVRHPEFQARNFTSLRKTIQGNRVKGEQRGKCPEDRSVSHEFYRVNMIPPRSDAKGKPRQRLTPRT